MKQKIHALVVKVAQRCNLNCSYCYMYNHEDQSWRQRPKFMSLKTWEALLERVAAYCDLHPGHKMSLTLHGGEPTLLPKQTFAQFAQMARERLGERLNALSIQTNATLIDEEWVDLLKKYEVHPGVSMDGPPEIHDRYRVDHAGRGSLDATVKGLNLMREAGLDPGILCVINPGHSGLEVYRYFRSLGIKRINFLLPDVSHDHKDRWYGQYGDTPVADYLLPIFDEWFAEDDPSIRLRIFWGLLRMLMGGWAETDAFGTAPMGYLVVESDGEIEALDALKVCASQINSSGLNVLRNGFEEMETGLPLVHQLITEGLPLPTACANCPEKEICGGGYAPHRWSNERGFDNPSVWCKDIFRMITHLRTTIGVPNENAVTV